MGARGDRASSRIVTAKTTGCGLCLRMCFWLVFGEVWGMYQAKERPSSDTKYDVYFWEQSKQAKSDCKENKWMESSLKTPKLELELLGG